MVPAFSEMYAETYYLRKQTNSTEMKEFKYSSETSIYSQYQKNDHIFIKQEMFRCMKNLYNRPLSKKSIANQIKCLKMITLIKKCHRIRQSDLNAYFGVHFFRHSFLRSFFQTTNVMLVCDFSLIHNSENLDYQCCNKK